MEREDELKQVIEKAREELREIESAQQEKEHKNYVGKFFVYDNSYGSGDHWLLYIAITSIGEGGSLEGWQFETTSEDECTIHFEEEWYSVNSLGERITKAKFYAAYRRLLKRLAKLEV